MRQIFGFTFPRAPEQGYVGFAMAFAEDNGDFSLNLRQHGGGANGEIVTLPRAQAVMLAKAILDADDARWKAEVNPTAEGQNNPEAHG